MNSNFCGSQVDLNLSYISSTYHWISFFTSDLAYSITFQISVLRLNLSHSFFFFKCLFRITLFSGNRMSQAHPLPCPKIQDLLLLRRPRASLVKNSIKTWITGTGEIKQREGLKLMSFQMLLVNYLTCYRVHVRQNFPSFQFIHIKQDYFQAIS